MIDILRGDIVKDDSGAYAVFTEQGSSASQMTAAKVMDVIARLPDFDGRAAYAVSAYTQENLEDAPRFLRMLRIPKSPKSWSSIEDPVVPLERKLVWTPTGRIVVGKTIRGSSVGTWWEKVPNWECMFVHRAQGLV